MVIDLKLKYKPLFISCSLLLLVSLFIYDWRFQLITACLLFLPFFDKSWRLPNSSQYANRWLIKIILILVICMLMVFYPSQRSLILTTLLLTALPEEFFFRAYLQSRLISLMQISKRGRARITRFVLDNIANIYVSIFFALLHLPVQGVKGLMVFFPSLLFGWIYQKTSDLLLVVLSHALANLILFIYLLPRTNMFFYFNK